LWHDARGEWEQAHTVVSDHDPVGPDVTGPAADCARVHAYLHRKEGDLSNARYWYARANKSPATDPLDDEWAAIVTELLRPSPSRS